MLGSMKCLGGWSRPVGGEIQHISRIAELFTPISGLLLEKFALQSLPLPSRKIRVLDGQFPEPYGMTADETLIQSPKLTVEHSSRRNIPSNVMGQDQRSEEHTSELQS